MAGKGDVRREPGLGDLSAQLRREVALLTLDIADYQAVYVLAGRYQPADEVDEVLLALPTRDAGRQGKDALAHRSRICGSPSGQPLG